MWFDSNKVKPPLDSDKSLELWWAGGPIIGYFDDGLFEDGSFWIPATVPYGLGFADEGRDYKKLISPSKWRHND